jgi:negative regulator of sigma E activity
MRDEDEDDYNIKYSYFVLVQRSYYLQLTSLYFNRHGQILGRHNKFGV